MASAKFDNIIDNIISDSANIDEYRKKFMLHAAILFTPVGLIGCGLGTAFLKPKNYKAGVGAHIEAQFNALWMMAIGAAVPHLDLTPASIRRMYYLALMGTYSHIVVYGIMAISGGKYELLPQATSEQWTIAPLAYQNAVKVLLFGPVLCGMVGSGMLL